MPMCIFGCDSLFEDGFITVDENGTIQTDNKDFRSENLDAYLGEVQGTVCTNSNQETQRYFSFHRAYHQQSSSNS